MNKQQQGRENNQLMFVVTVLLQYDHTTDRID